MEVQVLDLAPRRLSVELTGTTAAQANAIRRTLLSDIPKLAIDDVEFHLGPIRDEATGKDYDSSTSMFDEAVALRLGLLPIPTDLGEFRRKSECTCGGEGCPHCQVMYAVDRKGPCTVYARDVTPLGDASLAMLEPDVPIVRLGARQALLAYATAVVGSAREHAKWQVAHAVGVWPRAHVKTHKRPGCTEECLERVVRSAPAGILEIEDGRLRLNDDKPERTIDLVGLERVCPHGSLQIELDESDRFLRFETDGSLPARDAFRFALKDLKRRFEELREAVQALP
jgi:DNA-directed RNA polymerase subunit D